MQIILCGGGNIVEHELESIDKEVINSSKNKKILVLDLTTNDPNKIIKYKKFLQNYFLELGAKKIEFISDYKDNKIENKFNEFGIIYLPGGNPVILLENINKRNLSGDIKNFNGVILGNSAGALVLSKTLIITKDEDFPETISKEGLGIVPFSVEVHYDKGKDEELKKLNLPETIYAIPEKSYINVEDEKIIFNGKIKIFRGAEERI